MRALLRRKGVPNWPHGHGYGHGHGHGHQFERVQIVLFFCLLCAAFLPVWGIQLYYTVLYCIILHSIILYYTFVYCIIPYHSIL